MKGMMTSALKNNKNMDKSTSNKVVYPRNRENYNIKHI